MRCLPLLWAETATSRFPGFSSRFPPSSAISPCVHRHITE